MSDDAQPTMWDLGRYEQLAAHLEPAAVALAETAGPGEGQAALDVAAGTGSAALHLARHGWQVVATDSSSRMLELGAARTAAEQAAVDWRHADLATQPVVDGEVALVVSSFGIIFGADAGACAAEAARVLAPGGRLLLTAWPEQGYMVEMTARMMPFLPGGDAPADAADAVAPEPQGPMRWATPERLEALLAPHFADVVVSRRTLPWRFADAGTARRFLQEASPAHVAAMGAAGDRAQAMMDAVEQHLSSLAEPDGRVDLAADYLLASATLSR